MSADQQSRLAVELEYYAQHKPEWLSHKTGHYVVIKDSALLGFYPNFEAAYRAGAATYGQETDFLVKQILEHEPVFFVF
jgi:ethanolamine utilization cobalamin adenosyltransferase